MRIPRPTLGIDGRIFVVGVPRSGTTLVQSLLAAHSTATSFTESHFFDRHFTVLPLLGWPVLTRHPGARLSAFLEENGERPPPGAASLVATTRRTPRALLPLRTRQAARRLLEVLDELTLARGRSRWVEKTPAHLRYVPFLERLTGPGSRTRFVHVVRDGLEVVASLYQASRSWQRHYDVATCVRRWNTEVGLSLRRIGSPSDRFVLYEELTARPEATLRRLLAGLDLDWEPEILERYARTSESLVRPEETAWKANVGRGIRSSATSDRALTAEQRRRAERSLRRDLYERLRQRSKEPTGVTGGEP